MKLRWGLVGVALSTVLVGGCVSPVGVPETKVMPVVNLRHGGEQAQGYYELGRYYQSQNRYVLALDAYDKALATDPRHVEALNGRAALFAAQGRYDEAERDLRAALALAPAAAHLHNNLGYTLLLQQRPADAVVALEEAARLDPKSPKTWNNLGIAYAGVGDAVRAESSTRRANELVTARASFGRISAPREAAPARTPQQSPAAAATPVLPPGWQLIGAAPGGARPAPNEPVTASAAASVPPAAVEQPKAPAVPAYRLEVANGNGVDGMARKVGALLAVPGMRAPRLTNQVPYTQRATEIQYRDGHAAAAAALGERLPANPQSRISERLRFDTDVRVILGADCADAAALAKISAAAARIARNAEPAPVRP